MVHHKSVGRNNVHSFKSRSGQTRNARSQTRSRAKLPRDNEQHAEHNWLPKAAVLTLPFILAAAPASASTGLGAVPLALGGGAAIAALSAALIATDPAQRRKKQTAAGGGSEKDAVRSYFNNDGFSRWNKIYGQTEDVNKVQLDIRTGHAQTVDKVLGLVGDDLDGTSVCDAGCGTGSLAIPLALRGAEVSASDISQSMANEAERRYNAAVSDGAKRPRTTPQFLTSDLESLSGEYDLVTCLDVMIHYPQEDADKMIAHLASLAKKKLIISFAPKTLQYSILKRIGELFPGPSKATRAYLHAEADVEQALNRAGFQVKSRDLTATSFYFSRLLEAVRV